MNEIKSLMDETVYSVTRYLSEHGGEVELTAFIRMKNNESVPVMYPGVSVEAFTDLLRVILKLTKADGYVVVAESQYTEVSCGDVSPEEYMASNPDMTRAIALIGETRSGQSSFCLIDIERDDDGLITTMGEPNYPDVDAEQQAGALAHLFDESDIIDIDALIEKMPQSYMDDIEEMLVGTRVIH